MAEVSVAEKGMRVKPMERMGDAKWTMLAVACFGIGLGLYSWAIGSVLATIYIGSFRLFKVQVTKVTFSPFLFG